VKWIIHEHSEQAPIFILIILSPNSVGFGFNPSIKILHFVAEKKLIKREQHDENSFSIILPSVKFFGEAKNKALDVGL